MKFFFLVLILLFIKLQTFSQGTLKITGNCPLIKDGTEITLIKWVPRRFSGVERKIVTKSVNNRFGFEVQAEGGEGYLLYANKKFIKIYANPGKADILISDSTLNKVTITGNITNTEYVDFSLSLSNSLETKTYNIARINYLNYLGARDVKSNMLEDLKKKTDSLIVPKRKKDIELTLNFILQHPSSYLNTLILFDVINEVSEDTIKNIYKNFHEKNIKNTWGKELKYRIDSLFIGSIAPNFVQTDTAGKQVSLNSFRGKYLLIDFWASWCIPCRAETPNLIKASNEYKNKNFSILSISLDSDRAKWLKAIKDDRMTWANLSDLKTFQNDVSVKYYVYAIPDNYLVDPSGKIIAKNIRGEELNKTLSKVLGH